MIDATGALHHRLLQRGRGRREIGVSLSPTA
jgi:hypothetical protein